MAQILVSNLCSVPRAEIIYLAEDSHVWGKNSTLNNWVSSGRSAHTWPRYFSLVKVTDKTKDELIFLNELLDHKTRRYHFTEPDQQSEIWQELYATGEYSAPWSVVQQYIVDRGAI